MTIERAELVKQVMRQIPYPVTIVTSASGDTMRGITIGSFTSLSLDPPLICFNVEKSSQMHDLLSEAEFFAVHIPHGGNEELCNRFATPDLDDREQWKDIPYRLDSHGVPHLDDVAVVVECRNHSCQDGGDHSIFSGEVLKVNTHSDDPGIYYFNGAYYTLPNGK